MPCMTRLKRYRRMYSKERKEHPDLKPATVRRIVRDHMKIKRFNQ